MGQGRQGASNQSAYNQATPEARIAVIALRIHSKLCPSKAAPKLAEYRDALKVHVEKELILARIEEARKVGGVVLTARVAELAIELAEIEKRIPIEDHLYNVER